MRETTFGKFKQAIYCSICAARTKHTSHCLPQIFLSALRLKRAEVSGHIHDLEKRIARHRANLANIDAKIRLFSPGDNPDAIPPKRPYKRRTRYFAHNELPRLALGTLRLAPAPLAAGDIAAAIMRAKNMPIDDPSLKEVVTERLLTVMRGLLKRGEVTKTGTSRNAQWAIVPELL